MNRNNNRKRGVFHRVIADKNYLAGEPKIFQKTSPQLT
jgi:hypothetical protein